MRNIIFLDIDGVLNSERSLFATGKFIIPYTIKNMVYDICDFGLDHIAVGMLKKICDECQCKIVISSSWGDCLSVDHFIHIFKQYDFDVSTILLGKISHDSSNRAANIKNWIHNHCKIDDVCVVIDDSLDLATMKNSVIINPDIYIIHA